jgi:hypothetical protein
MNDTPQLDHQELIRRVSRDLAVPEQFPIKR